MTLPTGEYRDKDIEIEIEICEYSVVVITCHIKTGFLRTLVRTFQLVLKFTARAVSTEALLEK